MNERKSDSQSLSIQFESYERNESLPRLALFAVTEDQRWKKLAVVDGEKIKVDRKWEGAGFTRFSIGPDVEDVKMLPEESLMNFHPSDILNPDRLKLPIIIAERWWRHWFPFFQCVSGSVRRCFPWVHPIRLTSDALQGIAPPFQIRPIFSPLCLPMCDGIVEVYERTCCCSFIHLRPEEVLPRLPELIPIPLPFPIPLPDPTPFNPLPPVPGPLPLLSRTASEFTVRTDIHALSKNRLVKNIRDFDPQPDPPHEPIEKLALAHGLNEESSALYRQLNIDYRALLDLPSSHLNDWLIDRPYLWPLFCHCSVKKIGQTTLRPNGQFDFCWPSFLPPLKAHCHRRYAYVVKQWHGGQWVEVYNGINRHEYFKRGDAPVLRSYLGHSCHEPPTVPHDKPYLMLQRIGSGGNSHRLNSHWLGKNAAGLDLTQKSDVALHALPENGGLFDASATDSPSTNRPWAQSLSLLLNYSESMKALGAHYYRISYVPVQDNGEPVAGATPTPLQQSIGWLRVHFIAGQPEITTDNLGPVSLNVAGQAVNGLYRIPYLADGHWLGGQAHAVWDTSALNGRFLLYVEVFNAAGTRLDPNTNGFDFLRRLSDSGADSLSIVRFKQLAHVFWTDNKPVFAEIADLRKDGIASSAECQFMSGNANSLFSAGFSAFHTTRNHAMGPRTFMSHYTLHWKRGLNGPEQLLDDGELNAPANLNPLTPEASAAQSFGAMLGPHAKCTFALTLRVYCRHTNGSGHIHAFDRSEVASFALDITPSP